MASASNWMSSIPNSRKIIHVNIPGTHDSGTFNTVVPYAQTQSWSISEQLNNGIRFFDIRLSKVVEIGEEKLPVYILMHGPAPVGGELYNDVLAPIRDFLLSNPSEMVFMSIKEENSRLDMGNADLAFFTQVFPLFYDHHKGLRELTMGDVRGKVVMLNRVTEDYGYVWKDLNIQDEYELEMTYYQQVIVPGVRERTVRICKPWSFDTNDCYEQVIVPGVQERTQSVPVGWDYNKKTEHIATFLRRNTSNPENNLNINFLTASSSDVKFLVPFPHGVAKNATQQNRFIARKNWQANGMIFPMDYPTQEAIDKIITSN